MSTFGCLLFVEDEPGQRELTERLYQMCAKSFHGEVEFLTAGDWKSGLAITKMRKVDAVLLDLVLPPMGRFETLEQLKRSSGFPPVIVLTNAEGDPELREKCFAAGASDFMWKKDANHHPEQLCEKAYHAYLRRLHEQAA